MSPKTLKLKENARFDSVDIRPAVISPDSYVRSEDFQDEDRGSHQMTLVSLLVFDFRSTCLQPFYEVQVYSLQLHYHYPYETQVSEYQSIVTQYVAIHRFYLAGSTSLPVRFLIQVSVNIASAFIKILSLMWCISLGLPTTWFCRLVSSVLSMTGDLRVISLEGNEKNSRSFNVFLLCSHHVG